MTSRFESVWKTLLLVILAASLITLTCLLVVDRNRRADEVSQLKEDMAAIQRDIEAAESENDALSEELASLYARLEGLTALGMDIAYLKESLSDLTYEVTGRVSYEPDAFKYFAIGNSITWHCKCDYWWNEIGMAASKPENDYYHRVAAYLKDAHGKVSSYALNYAIWETQYADRAQTYTALDPYLNDKLDLITVQLSENASNLTDFVNDYKELIAYLKQKCPNATILLIDDFWNEYKSQLKKIVADSCGVTLVSLAEIRNKTEYQSAIGATVYDDKGLPHSVHHSGVAAHPGDKGMAYIANAVIEALKK